MRLALAVLLPLCLSAQQYTVRTFAGGALPDNIPGTSAMFRGTVHHAVDKAGNIYVAVNADGIIMRWDAATGIVTRIAGAGPTAAFSQTTVALERRLGTITSIAVDGSGVLHYAELARLFKVVDGTLTVVAGNGVNVLSDGPALQASFGSITGMAFDASGDLYMVDEGPKAIRKLSNGIVSTVAGTGGTGNRRSLRLDLALDATGNIYVADPELNQVRKISGGVISVIADTTQLLLPTSIAVNAAGDVFVAEYIAHRIRKISNGTFTTIAGQGREGFSADGALAVDAFLNFPNHLRLDAAGNLLFADASNRIRKIASGRITTVVGGGNGGDGGHPAGSQLSSIAGMAVDVSGNLYIADTQNGRIRKVSNDIISTVTGTGGLGYGGDGGAARDALLSAPGAVALDSTGAVFFNDGRARIRRVGNGVIDTVVGTGIEGYSGDGGPANQARIMASGAAVSPSNEIFVTEFIRIRKVTGGVISTVAGTGTVGSSGDGGPAEAAQFSGASKPIFDSAGSLYFVDAGYRVRKITNGIVTTVAGDGTRPEGDQEIAGPATNPVSADAIAVDANGELYVNDGGLIRKVSGGMLVPVVGARFGAAPLAVDNRVAEGSLPSNSMVIDRAGNIYFHDSVNNGSRVRVLNPVTLTGPPTVSAVTSPSQFGGGTGIAKGSWVEIYGTNLGSHARGWNVSDFTGTAAPPALDGTFVTVGGVAALVAYVSPNQINAQIPLTVSIGTKSLVITTPVGTVTHQVTINPTQPGLFAPPSFKIGNTQYVGATFANDTTFVMPVNTVPGIASRPARVGDIITVFGTGFGDVTPAPVAGRLTSQQNNLTTPVQFFFGGTPAQVIYAGLAPGVLGLYQFNIVVPAVAPGNAVPLTFTQGGSFFGYVMYTAVTN